MAELSLSCSGRPQAAAAARRMLDALEGHVMPTLLDDLRLLATELITNSVRHSGTGEDSYVGIGVAVSDALVRVEVADDGAGFDGKTPTPAKDGASGWGLYLVEQLADRWGVIREDGTRVWFEIDRENERELDVAQA